MLFKMNVPKLYASFDESWFHYLWLIIMFIGFFYITRFMKDLSDKKLNRIFLIMSGTMIVFEIYKQILFTLESNSYQWYAFPFQFCSMGMYLSLALVFVKNKVIRESLIMFLATYSFFAGLSVMLYPSTVFVSDVGINIQTMVHHALLAVVGFGLLVRKIDFKFKSFFKGSIVFFILLMLAVILNTIHNTLIKDGTFNMFFINPKYQVGLPILDLIQPKVGGITFVIVYFLGFNFVALMMFGLGITINKLIVSSNKDNLKLRVSN